MPFDTAKRMLHYDFPPGVEYDLAIDFNSYQCSCAVGALTVPAKYRVMWIHNDVRVKLEKRMEVPRAVVFLQGKVQVLRRIRARIRRAVGNPSRRCPE